MKRYQILYCFRARVYPYKFKIEQALEYFEGTKSDLEKYIEKLESKGCYGINYYEMETQSGS